MRARPYVAAPLLLLLAGCAGASTSADSAQTAPGQPAGTATSATAGSITTEGTGTTEANDGAEVPPAPDGEDAASALSGFACSPAVGVSQLWNASGTLANDRTEPATYRVTVVVVDSTGAAGIAAQRLVDVEAGDSAEVDLGRVRGPLDGTCQVQVLRVG